MRCYSDGEWRAELDGAVDTAEAETMRQHRLSCRRCQQRRDRPAANAALAEPLAAPAPAAGRRGPPAALAAGLDYETCHNYRGIRQVAMCDAWHGPGATTPVTPQSFRARVDESWATVKHDCASHGGDRPETGFLEPATSPTEVYDVRRNGRHEGLLVVQPDGEVTACLENRCRDVRGGQQALDSLRSLLEVQGFEVVAE